MYNLEQENIDLKATVKQLTLDNAKKEKAIHGLTSVALSLSNFKDVSSVLKDILTNVQDVTNSDGGTIYLTDGKKLSFKHIVNKSLNIKHYNCNENEDVWNFIDIKSENNNNLVAASCALTKKIICIDDIYDSVKYDFSGTKDFDSNIGYHSKTMLVIPMLLSDNTLVGVLQLINKLDEDGNIITFDNDDEEIANSLASQASTAIDKFRQSKLLMNQSKLAAMGEMIDAIAHQWKQPLNVINIIATKIDMYIDMDMPIENDMLKKSSDEITTQITHLTTTLDEFRSFLRPNKAKQIVNTNSMLKSVLSLLSDELSKYNITTEIIDDKITEVEVVENEFKHVFINIINNAKDAFIDTTDGENRKLIFEVKEHIDKVVFTISDNAGGIPEQILETIFNANVTTKEEGKGTGIGLYMSSQIVEKNNGILSVENIENGAMFTIVLNK